MPLAEPAASDVTGRSLWAPRAWLGGRWHDSVLLRIDAHGHWADIVPGIAGGIGQRPCQRRRVAVGRSILGVLQVVELADLRVAAAQQLDIELRRDRAQRVGRDARRHPVHAVAPRPEVVGRAGGACAAAFGEARERALERMAVGIDEAGQHRTVEPRRVGRRLGDAGNDVGPVTVRVDAQQHAVVPAPAEPGARRPQRAAGGVGRCRVSDRHPASSRASSGSARARSAAAPPCAANRPHTAAPRACSSATSSRAGPHGGPRPDGRSDA